ncbi:MAG: hypothetical protein ACRDYZ_08775, partial [Acidimicrobiales bacterium]
YVHSLDEILLIGAITAVAAGVLTLFLIRAKDFAAGSQSHRPAPAQPPTDTLAAAGNGAAALEPALVGAARDHAGEETSHGSALATGNGDAPRPAPTSRPADPPGVHANGSPPLRAEANGAGAAAPDGDRPPEDTAGPPPASAALVPATDGGEGATGGDVAQDPDDDADVRELTVSVTFRLRRPRGRRRT